MEFLTTNACSSRLFPFAFGLVANEKIAPYQDGNFGLTMKSQSFSTSLIIEHIFCIEIGFHWSYSIFGNF